MERTQSQREAEQAVMRELNSLFDRVMGGTRHKNSYLYMPSNNKLNSSRAQDRYFYTPHRSVHSNGKEGFLSGVYRYNASKKQWIAKKVVRHAKRKDAEARATRLRDTNA